jgi:ABC-type multidrug transport system fused ATPase/permease subunit
MSAYLKNSTYAFPIKLLSQRDRLGLMFVVVITICLALLDLFGILLIGVMGSLSITGLSAAPTGNRVFEVLRVLKIENLSFETQVGLIGLSAAVLLTLKTLLSLLLVKRTLFFMARRGASISADLVSRYFAIPVSRVNHRSAQTTIYALTSGVDIMMVSVVGASVALISDIALLIVMGAGLFLVDPITASGTALLFGLLAYVMYKNMHIKVSSLSREQSKLSIEISQRIFEAINSYRELLVRDRRGFYAKQIGDLRFKLADGGASIKYMSNLSKYMMEIALVLSACLLALYQFSTSTPFRAIATITIFIAASTRITPAILRLQQGLLAMKGAFAKASPTISLIQEIASVTKENFNVQRISRKHTGFSAEINALNISFSYDGTQKVIKNINFQVSPGEFVAIVGGSGAGKTTLVDLLLGALDPTSGSVKISKHDPRSTFSKWPGAVSYVPQDSAAIDGTIRENLGLGYNLKDIADKYCWESLKIASLEDFVKSLPDQLDEYVGDRGTRLSGGQRQRLGIARALLTSPKMLILDEATSALDGITEFEISESLRALQGEMTLIVIAHRLSTILKADRIYFLDGGEVKGVGKFEELKEGYPEFLAQAQLMGL